MSDDKIKKIRTWHVHYPPSRNAAPSLIAAYRDIATLLAEVDRLSSDLRVQQGCCDGAAAQDAHVRREREEHRAEVEKLRAENERLRAALKPFAAEAEAYDPPEEDDAETAWFSLFTCGNLRDARNALEGKP